MQENLGGSRSNEMRDQLPREPRIGHILVVYFLLLLALVPYALLNQ